MATRVEQTCSTHLQHMNASADPHPVCHAGMHNTDRYPTESDPPRLYLGSQSPRRLQLLGQLGLQPTLLLPDANEDAEALEAVRTGESPLSYVKRVTTAKGLAAWARLRKRSLASAPILVADTTVALGNRILGKPGDPDTAIAMLRQLSGQWHRVLTSVRLQTGPGRQALQVTVRSDVLFATLSESTLQAYVDSGEPLDKAGAYAIQGGAAPFVVRIRGSYTGIIGLPLHETGLMLQQAGVLPT